MFPHPDNTRYFIAGQANIIFQAHGPFHSPYQGSNSLLPTRRVQDIAGGHAVSGLELVRNPHAIWTRSTMKSLPVGAASARRWVWPASPTWTWCATRTSAPSPIWLAYELHQTIGFRSKMVDADRGPFSLATEVPERRLELRVGKMGLPDFFDINSVGTDSHLQFLNWTTDNNGAWDYAADTRGYTYGAIAEYDDKDWSARYGVALMPTVANGILLDWNLRRASGQNMEFEWRHGLLGRLVSPDRKGVMRVLSYVNHAHMGLYRDAVKAYLAGADPPPTITLHEKFGAVKYGFGLNAEQEFTDNLRVYRAIRLERGTARELCLHRGRPDH